jgi:hypothetical protein
MMTSESPANLPGKMLSKAPISSPILLQVYVTGIGLYSSPTSAVHNPVSNTRPLSKESHKEINLNKIKKIEPIKELVDVNNVEAGDLIDELTYSNLCKASSLPMLSVCDFDMVDSLSELNSHAKIISPSKPILQDTPVMKSLDEKPKVQEVKPSKLKRLFAEMSVKTNMSISASSPNAKAENLSSQGKEREYISVGKQILSVESLKGSTENLLENISR